MNIYHKLNVSYIIKLINQSFDLQSIKWFSGLTNLSSLTKQGKKLQLPKTTSFKQGNKING